MNFESLTSYIENKMHHSDGALEAFKREELNSLKKIGLKSPIKESYKFTPLERFLTNLDAKKDHQELVVTAHTAPQSTLRFIDGKLADHDLGIPGIKIKKLKDHFEEHKHLFKNHNALSHLHHSILDDGIIIEVKKHEEVSPYLKIIHTLTKSTVSAPTLIVQAQDFAKITIFEEVESSNASYTHVTETYLLAQTGACIEHLQMDHGSPDGIIHGSVFAEISKDATVRSFFFNTAGKLTRKNLQLNINAPGANGESYALFLTQDQEHSDINTVINHIAEETTSKQLAKGILDGQSKGIFTGKIHIHPKAQRVASSQLNKNLILSQKAQVHSAPQLEIFADDVKCSHGSTTGQLSDEELFYLKARGIPGDKARNLLAFGFGLEVVQKINHPKLRDHVGQIIQQNLEIKFNLKGIK